MILNIEFDNSFTLQFQVLDTPVADLWLDRMAVRNQYPLDDATRFYGFGSQDQEEKIALDKINHCIAQIKLRYPDIVAGPVTDVRDQDQLNYWHHVFETRHGFLEQEDRSDELTPVLADLNLAVHRCESVARGNRPRFVCTWYGLPKTETLTDELMQEYGTLSPKFGSVCLNYCEIGKTLEDLTKDRDNYIGDDAFRPFNHYSADFVVKFFEETVNEVAQRIIAMAQYHHDNREFFIQHGYKDFASPRLIPLRFPVAKLIETKPREQLLEQLRQHQTITRVELA